MQDDSANQVVHMTLEWSEAAVRLAGLGAKNLIALILAVMKDSEKLAGKTNMNALLRAGEPVTNFPMDKKTFKEFEKHAKKHGILYTGVRFANGDKNLVDVIYQEKNSRMFNAIMEGMQFPVPQREQEVKNAVARAQQGDKSSGRGFGFLQPASERKNRKMDNTGKFLEGLSEAALAGLLLEMVAGLKEQGKDTGVLAQAIGSKDFVPVTGDAAMMGKIQSSLQALGVSVPLVPGEDGKVMMLADKKDAPLINSSFQALGEKPPIPTTEQPAKRGPGRPPKQQGDRPSTKDKIEGIKQQQKAAAAKAPAKGKAKAPVRGAK